MGQKKERVSGQQDEPQCQRMQTMDHRQEGMQEHMKMMQVMMRQMMERPSVQVDQQ